MGNSLRCCEYDHSPPKFFEIRLQRSLHRARPGPVSPRRTILSSLLDLKEAATKSECSESKTLLKLTVTDATDTSSELEITPSGLKGSLRAARDGVVYFGCKRRAESVQGVKGEVLNDYVIRSEESEVRRHHRGRHFKINFDIVKGCYFLQDLGDGFGVFARLEFPVVRCT
jgi:hypothetical protein